MPRATFTICRPFGIPVRIGYSWLGLFLVVMLWLAMDFYPQRYPTMPPVRLWTLSALATLLYLGSLLLHEFGHALAAKQFGIPVHSVELFILGGVARMAGFTRRPRDEFVMAAAGPLVSAVLAAGFTAAYIVCWYGLDWRVGLVKILWHVAGFNTAVMIFNLLPAYPLDGGRILQGVLWWLTGRRALSAGIAALVGGGLAMLLVTGGVVTLLLRGASGGLGGVWLIALGLFIGYSAFRGYQSVRTLERIGHLTAAEAIDEFVRPLPAQQPPQTDEAAAIHYYSAKHEEAAPVVPLLDEHGRAVGMLIRYAAESPVELPTQPIDDRHRVAATMPLLETIAAMNEIRTPWMVVEDDQGRYLGTVTNASLHRLLRRR